MGSALWNRRALMQGWEPEDMCHNACVRRLFPYTKIVYAGHCEVKWFMTCITWAIMHCHLKWVDFIEQWTSFKEHKRVPCLLWGCERPTPSSNLIFYEVEIQKTLKISGFNQKRWLKICAMFFIVGVEEMTRNASFFFFRFFSSKKASKSNPLLV